MTTRNNSFLIRAGASILLLTCISIPLNGCTKAEPATPGIPVNNTREQQNSKGSVIEGLPSGVTVTKVLVDVAFKNNYRKKVELLSDCGKRTTITDLNGDIVTLNIEYDGHIMSVNGKHVTVHVERGGEQILTIPDQVVIEDEDNLGLKPNVEIEWVVDRDGQIESVELDD
ncbi:hypothetical protein D3C76_667900 [compost metagenome]